MFWFSNVETAIGVDIECFFNEASKCHRVIRRHKKLSSRPSSSSLLSAKTRCNINPVLPIFKLYRIRFLNGQHSWGTPMNLRQCHTMSTLEYWMNLPCYLSYFCFIPMIPIRMEYRNLWFNHQWYWKKSTIDISGKALALLALLLHMMACKVQKETKK